MRSTPVIAGQLGRIGQYNDLRDDARASSWLLPHEQTVPDLTLHVENGTFYINEQRVDFAGDDTATFTAPLVNDRIDTLSIDNTGGLVISIGDEDPSPVAPEVPENTIPICHVYNRVGQTEILDEDDTVQGYILLDTRPVVTSSSKIFLKFTTEQDLIAGDPAGFASFIEDRIAKGANPFNATPDATALASNKTFGINDMIWLTADKFVVSFLNNTASATYAVVCGEVDRATMNITWGNDENVTSSATHAKVQLVKLDIDKFCVATVNTINDPEIHVFSVSGVTINNEGSTNLFGTTVDNICCCQMATDAIFICANSSSGTQTYLAYITFATYTPTVVSTYTTTLGTPFTNGSSRNVCCKIDTLKAIICTGGVTSSQHRGVIVTMGGSITLGSVYAIGGSSQFNGLTAPNLSVLQLATNMVLFRHLSANTPEIKYSILNISGTTISVGIDTEGFVGCESGHMVLDTASGDVYDFFNSNDTDDLSGIYKLVCTSSTITRTKVMGPIKMADGASGGFIRGAYSVDNDYFIFISQRSGDSSSADRVKGNIYIKGMSVGFIGFVQQTMARGSDGYIRRDGDAHQSGLIFGANYAIENGVLVNTFDLTKPFLVQARRSDEVIVL